MELPNRKRTRLEGYDYSTPGAYFLTICAAEKKTVFGTVVGGGDLDAPYACLLEAGMVVRKYIELADHIPGIRVDKYVVMPNHIHIILLVEETDDGTSRSPSPTNAKVPRFVGAMKRFCNKEMGTNLFQRSYYDHIIRDERDYRKIWNYIDTNPARWQEDCFYCKESPKG